MKSLSARALEALTPTLDPTRKLIRDLCVASAHILGIGLSLLPIAFYAYARAQALTIATAAGLA